MDIHSGIPDIIWPALAPVHGANMLALLYQLEQTQWWTPDRLRTQQFRQIASLLRHARTTVPYYQNTLAHLDSITDGTCLEKHWEDIPVMTRLDVQRAGETLFSTAVPDTHGQLVEIKTSGSTGSPVKVMTSGVAQHFWRALTLREHLWHRLDFMGKLAVIRRAGESQAMPPDGTHFDTWGLPVDLVFHSGPSAMLSIVSTTEQQAQWLARERADYLLTFPTLLKELLTHCAQTGMRLDSLKQVRTLGEVVTPELRAQCQAQFGVPLVDMYSNQEAGYLAMQCPEHDHYHVQSENVLLEILDEDNRPCAIGATGRVVITALHNFATPLLRYETGDYAQVGEPCTCRRGLPVIQRILGRARNMLIFPSGERRFPLLGGEHYADFAPVRQYRMIQRRIDLLEVQLVVSRTPNDAELARLREFITRKMGPEFQIELTIVASLSRTAGGKFEDFARDPSIDGVSA